jgi:hypothetical protein
VAGVLHLRPVPLSPPPWSAQRLHQPHSACTPEQPGCLLLDHRARTRRTGADRLRDHAPPLLWRVWRVWRAWRAWRNDERKMRKILMILSSLRQVRQVAD